MDLDEMSRKYIALRDKKDEVKEKHKAELAPFNEVLSKLDALFLEYLNEQGLQNIATKHATIYKGVSTSVKVADWEAVLSYIREQENWQLLDHRVSKSMVQDMLENGEIVPGVSVRKEAYARVNRKS